MRRLAMIGAGLALVAAAAIPDRPLTSHMVAHLLLTLVAAPLLAVSAPVRLLLAALPPTHRRRAGRLLASRTARLLLHPLAGWLLFVGVLLGTHLTGFYDAAMRHPALHLVEHWLFLGSALVFWAGLFAADPVRHRLGWLGRSLSVLLAMPAMSIVGIVLIEDDHVRYAAYAGPAALADQHAAGRIMWLGGALAGAGLLFAVAWSALAQEERRQRVRDLHAGGRPV